MFHHYFSVNHLVRPRILICDTSLATAASDDVLFLRSWFLLICTPRNDFMC